MRNKTDVKGNPNAFIHTPTTYSTQWCLWRLHGSGVLHKNDGFEFFD